MDNHTDEDNEKKGLKDIGVGISCVRWGGVR